MAAVVRHLTGASHAVAAECANVILNLCFERANVSRLLKCNGVAPLVSLLKSSNADVQASACGVIQSICYLVSPPTRIDAFLSFPSPQPFMHAAACPAHADLHKILLSTFDIVARMLNLVQACRPSHAVLCCQ